jgi:hypothetical protein
MIFVAERNGKKPFIALAPGKVLWLLWVFPEPLLDVLFRGRQELGLRSLRAQDVVGSNALQPYKSWN